MLKALTGLLVAGAAALAIASPAAAAPVCSDGYATNVSGPYPPPYGYIVYFDVRDYCTGDSGLQIYWVGWGGAWYSGTSGGLDGIYGDDSITVTVIDSTLTEVSFQLLIDP